MKFADLHCHSTASDGTLAPADVVRLAAERGLSALALTDHDTIAGLAEASAAADAEGIDFLPGIEVSCAHPRPGTLHLLGYGFDIDHPRCGTLPASWPTPAPSGPSGSHRRCAARASS